MAQKKFTEMSLEELKEKEKTYKNTITALSSIVTMLFIIGIALTIRKGFNSFTVLPVAFLGIVVASQNSLKSVRAEIKSREG
jgi:hypothetical protein